MSGKEDQAFFKVFNDEMDKWIVPRRKSKGGVIPKKDGEDKFYPKVEHGLFGLAISGGGIRSATYALGVLQRMAKRGVIKFVDVLSTASGGGYIGSCWSSLTADAPEFGSDETNFPFQFIDKENKRQVFDRESAAVRHLRAHGYWLAPHLGLFDVWTWAAFLRYVFSTVINILLIPAPWVLGLMMLTLLIPDTFWSRANPLSTPINSYMWLLPAILLLIFLVTAWSPPRLSAKKAQEGASGESKAKTSGYKAKFVEDALKPSEEQSLSSFQRIVLKTAVILLLADLFILGISGLVHFYEATITWVITAGGAGAALVTAGGTIFRFFTKEVQGGVAKNGTEGIGKKALGFAVSIVGYVALAVILATIYIVLYRNFSPGTNPGAYKIITAGSFALAAAMLAMPVQWFLNEFSLQALYRQGMKSAYILKKNKSGSKDAPPEDEVVAREENFPLTRLMTGTTPPDMPYHLIVTAINSRGDKELKKLGRKSDSFIFANLHSGSRVTGYASTKNKYADVYLSDAMAISGAALSPNMGQYTTTSFSILLSLLNIRIGSWIDNPNYKKTSWIRRDPLVWYWLKELLGTASADGKYIYLSDGGHFDNSAIYELLKRRCKYILAIDAGKGFGNLAAVARLARIDFGVQIEVDTEQINLNPETGYSEKPYIVARLKYPPLHGDDGPNDGVLIWMSTTMTKKEKPDVLEYRETDPGFPFNTTGDQFFDQRQFEAYRELGHTAAKTWIDDACLPEKPGWNSVTLAFERLLPPEKR